MYKKIAARSGAFSLNYFYRAALDAATTSALVLLMASAACAYTIIMRDGRRVEIPANFTVNGRTLTYEAAPNINVTLQLSTIDISATERANNEQPGGIFKHVAPEAATAQANKPPNSSSTKVVNGSSTSARRTITNRDLEASRRTRLESEAAYERRRRELGLPSLEETRRRNEEQARRLREELSNREAADSQAESYWRSRADELRTEIAVIDAEI